eukprot:NODE_152_length_16986_cov_0.478119.p5 type:complete len:391 gc:universal NODE_152_length_16986_cov_0.478119:11322-10150(-)
MNRKDLWLSLLNLTEIHILEAKNLFSLYAEPINTHPLQQDRKPELISMIENDVARLFPKEPYFTAQIKIRVSQILLVYCKMMNIEYRQGFHDLVGFIMYAINASTQNDMYIAFVIFVKINSLVKYWYFDKVESIHSTLEFQYIPRNLDMQTNEVRIQHECRFVVDHILQRFDRRIWERLKEIGLEPHVFGIRWIRTLFIHEFDFSNSLILWDHFLYNLDKIDKNFFLWLPKFVFAAIIQHLREEILLSDINGGMVILMRPHLTDVESIINLAKETQDEFLKTGDAYLDSLQSKSVQTVHGLDFEALQNVRLSLSNIERDCRFDKPNVLKELRKIYLILGIPTKLAKEIDKQPERPSTKNTLEEIKKELDSGDLQLKRMSSQKSDLVELFK